MKALNKEILRLALPSILANITVPLVGMADVAIAGHLSRTGAAALIGGISIGSMLFDLLYWNFGFLRAGTAGLTAQAYGREKAGTASHDEPSWILLRALGIAWISAFGLILLQWFVVWAAFLVVDCSPEVRTLATQYFHIRIWAAPATLSLFAFKGWFIGLQDTVRPMTADLLVNGINILASLLLALGFSGGPVHMPAMGFPGIALGTVIAQWSGLAYCFIALHRRYPSRWHAILYQLKTYAKSFRHTRRMNNQQSPESQRFIRQNRDLFLRSVGMIAVYIGFTVISARFGDLMLAVSTILMKLLMLFSYFTDGFAYAGEALTGRFIGEGSRDGVRATVRGTFAWGLGVMALFLLVYGLGGTPLLRLMTSDAAVVEAGRQFIPWLLLMPLIGCPAFVWDGIFIGATASRDLRNSTLLCAVGFFAVWFLGIWMAGSQVSPATAIHILMAAYFMHLAIRTLWLTLRYRPSVLDALPA